MPSLSSSLLLKISFVALLLIFTIACDDQTPSIQPTVSKSSKHISKERLWRYIINDDSGLYETESDQSKELIKNIVAGVGRGSRPLRKVPTHPKRYGEAVQPKDGPERILVKYYQYLVKNKKIPLLKAEEISHYPEQDWADDAITFALDTPDAKSGVFVLEYSNPEDFEKGYDIFSHIPKNMGKKLIVVDDYIAADRYILILSDIDKDMEATLEQSLRQIAYSRLTNH